MKKLSIITGLMFAVAAQASVIPFTPGKTPTIPKIETKKTINWSGKSIVTIYDAAKSSKSPAINLLATVMVTNVIDGAAVADFLNHENNPDAKRVTCETGLERADVAAQVVEGIRNNQEWMEFPAGVAVMASYLTIFCKIDPI